MSTAAMYLLRLVAVCLALNGVAVAQSVLVLAVFHAASAKHEAPRHMLQVPTMARMGYGA